MKNNGKQMPENTPPTEAKKITNAMFRPIADHEKADAIVRPSLTYWQDAWRRLRRNPPAMVGLVIILIMAISCIIIPMFSAYTYDLQIRADRNLAPCAAHIFGTDDLGRDLFIRVVYGARISLSIGLVASLINLTIGVLYGGISGYMGGKVDMILMRIVEILDSIPLLLYVILLQVTFKEPMKAWFQGLKAFKGLQAVGPQLLLVYIVLGLVYWVGMARIVRGQVMTIKGQEYVMAAKSQGASTMRIILRHLIPNSVGQIIVMGTMAIPTAIFTESFLSYIGLGVAVPMASWGSLASDAVKGLQSFPYRLLFPAGAICLTVLSFNLLGDGLRDALDPRLRK